MLAQPGQRVEEGGFAGVGVADQTQLNGPRGGVMRVVAPRFTIG